MPKASPDLRPVENDASALSMDELAKRLFDAIEAADVETVRAIYAPGAMLWSSATGRAMPARDVAAFLPVMAKRMPDRKYANRRVQATADGFVQRHRLTGTNRDGGRVALEACVVATVENGRVTRIEEYCDGRQLKAVTG